jgi:hypothetical protein
MNSILLAKPLILLAFFYLSGHTIEISVSGMSASWKNFRKKFARHLVKMLDKTTCGVYTGNRVGA